MLFERRVRTSISAVTMHGACCVCAVHAARVLSPHGRGCSASPACGGRTFREIARVEGKSAQERKIRLITKLLVESKGIEPGYIMRALQARIGSAPATAF
jgi:hypothetical protein